MPSAFPYIPFAEAISEKALLKRRFEQFTTPQKVVLKALYGLPLANADERAAWAVLNGACTFDPLGYPVDVYPDRVPYRPKEYNQLWALFGRRSGKSGELGAFIFGYETTCGGHLDYVRPGQPVAAVVVAQIKDLAVDNLKFIRLVLEDSPLLAKEIASITNDSISLRNSIVIAASSPNIKNLRGWAMPAVAMDEVAFWYRDADSANPDFEVERAIAPAQAQFPRYKRFGITSVWTKDGLAYKYHKAGTEGCRLPLGQDRTEYQDILFFEAPTAVMAPSRLITREYLIKERARDEEAFEREYLSKFSDAVSGFLPLKLIEAAVDRGVTERPAKPRPGHPTDNHPTYVAAIDPAFRSDAFAFCIAHHEPGVGVAIDVLRRFVPTVGQRLNPQQVLLELQPLLQAYRIKILHSDQYQLETLQQLALGMGIIIEGTDFTSASKGRIFGNLQQLVNQGRLRLLDPAFGGAPSEAFHELTLLERHRRPNGSVLISAPQGKHDDMACVMALAAVKANWLMPTAQVQAVPERKIPTPFEMGMATIKRAKMEGTAGMGMEEWD